METGRHGVPLDGERGLQQARDAGGSFEVPDVGLHRADRQGRGACGAEDGPEGRGLDGVADRGAGAVQFDVADRVGGDPGAGVRGAEDGLLGGGAGRGEAGAAAVVVDGAAADDRVDPVAIGEGPVQWLEDDDTTALATYEPVGAFVEGEAAAVRGESAEAQRGDGAVGGQDEVDAAGERQLRLAARQALAREVDGDQGGGLARVHGEAGAAQSEGVGQAVGDEAALESRHGVPVDARGALAVQEGGVVVPDRAEEDTGATAAQAGGDVAGVLQRLPGEFEGEALLWVGGGGLARGDAEEAGVEVGGLFDESAAGGSGDTHAVGGGLGDRVGTRGEQVPQPCRSGCAGQPARVPDDRECLGTTGVRIRHECPEIT
ncbi:hypothetical protein GCM10010232_38500 [Streptomyces amakusaensis]